MKIQRTIKLTISDDELLEVEYESDTDQVYFWDAGTIVGTFDVKHLDKFIEQLTILKKELDK